MNKKKVIGVIHIGENQFNVEGDFDGDNMDITAVLTTSEKKGDKAWELLNLFAVALGELARSEVKERYLVEEVEE